MTLKKYPVALIKISFILLILCTGLQAAVWKSPDLLNNDWSNWSGLNGGASLIEPPAPDSEVNIKIGFFRRAYLTTRFSTVYSYLEHPVISGKRYEYTIRARMQADIISINGIFDHSWFSSIIDYKSSPSSGTFPIPNYSYGIKNLTAIINEDVIELRIYSSIEILGNATVNYSYSEYDWARLKQVIYVPKLDIVERNICVTPYSIENSSVTIGLHLNDLSFADTPTSWSIDWGDGTVESNPTLNTLHEHTYHITTGIGQTWTATLYGSNQAGSSSDFANIFVVPEPITITVDDDGPADFDNIQAAIDAACCGETIIVADGTYTGLGNRDIDFLGKAITVRSTDPQDPDVVAATIIDCENTGRGFYFRNGEDTKSVISGLTITNGYEDRGAAIYCDYSNPTITNCILTNNSARREGSAIYCSDSNPTIINCTVNNNSAQYGAAIYCKQGKPIIINSKISTNSGGGIYCERSSPIIAGCIISGNTPVTMYDYGGEGIYGRDSNTTINNCTIIGNSFCGVCSWHGTANITNSILFYNGGGRDDYHNIHGDATVTYSNVQMHRPDGEPWPGIGNINADPCFVELGYWDCDDRDLCFWVEGDYHLLADSPCINAGDPNYLAEPNETDLDGLPRVIGGRIDMGCYEFNHQPVANAGPNQTAYARFDAFADVNLDGSASFDDDNDVLDYYWSWTIDGNDCEANGVTPIIELPVGEYEIELIVDDGIDFSEPDYCTITVIEPIEAQLRILPRTINRRSRMSKVITWMHLPEGITEEQINTDELLVLYPGQTKAIRQRTVQHQMNGDLHIGILAFFAKFDLMNAISDNGRVEIQVVGKLKTGQYFYGSDTIRMIDRHWR